MLLSKGNLMVHKVASESDLDHGLNCIRVEADGGTVAANGKTLMAVEPTREEAIHFPDVGERMSRHAVSIPLELVEQAIRNLPRDKRPSLQHVALTANADPRKIELTTVDRNKEQRVAGYPMKEGFPDWRGVMRRVRGDATDTQRICLNRKELLRLLNALEEACPDKSDENPVFIEFGSDMKGLLLRCINRESGQRAIGCLTGYNVHGNWMPLNEWEQRVLQSSAKVKKV